MRLGLVTYEMSAANDPVAEVEHRRPRLPVTPLRLALALAPLGIALVTWSLWHLASGPPQPEFRPPVAAPVKTSTVRQEMPATITPIATRVLNGDPARSRESPLPARAAAP